MKVLLIFPYTSYMNCIPLAPYSLASVLRKEGFDVDVIDLHVTYGVLNTDGLKKILRGADAIGFSCLTLNWCYTKIIIELIRKLDNDIPIVLGGVHPSYFDEHVLKVSGANFVIRGEGEVSFLNLLRALRDGESVEHIKGLTYKARKGKIVSNPAEFLLTPSNLDKLPLPAYDLVSNNNYSMLPYESSRGCRHGCFFCSITHKRNWRGKRASRVVSELLTISKRHGKLLQKQAGIFLVDDCFTADRERAIEISTQLAKKDYSTPIIIEARINDLLDRRLLQSLAKINVYEIQVGVECGYDEGLGLVRKHTTIENVIKCAQLLKEFGLGDKLLYSFILGLPWETEKEMLRTCKFASQLVNNYGGWANLAWWCLYPSYGWEMRHEYGIKLDESIYDSFDSRSTQTRFYLESLKNVSKEFSREIQSRVRYYQSIGIAIACNPL